MTAAAEIRKNILTDRMDQLQAFMESNHHMKNEAGNQEVWDLILKLQRFWGAMDDEDKDYIEVSKAAVLERRSWNL
jgi:hypothetical protein|tara:strand:+ start:43 stop:270 length:228 start_codon:yes stop_codon:yes gene_type:complete